MNILFFFHQRGSNASFIPPIIVPTPAIVFTVGQINNKSIKGTVEVGKNNSIVGLIVVGSEKVNSGVVYGLREIITDVEGNIINSRVDGTRNVNSGVTVGSEGVDTEVGRVEINTGIQDINVTSSVKTNKSVIVEF